MQGKRRVNGAEAEKDISLYLKIKKIPRFLGTRVSPLEIQHFLSRKGGFSGDRKMVSEGMGNGLSPAIVFHDDGAAAFGSSRKTAPVGAFVDQKLFSDDRERYFRGQSDFRRGMFCSEEERRSGASGSGQEVGQSRRSDGRDWRQRGESDCDDDDDDDEDDDEDEEEDDDGGEGEMEALVNGKGGSKPIMPGNDGAKDTNIHVSSNNGSGGGDNSTSGGSLLSVSEKVREGNLERENGGNKGNSEKHLPSFGTPYFIFFCWFEQILVQVSGMVNRR